MELFKTSLIDDANLQFYSRYYYTTINTLSPNYSFPLTQAGTVTVDAAGKYNSCITATFSAVNYLSSSSFYNFRTSNISMGMWIKIATPPSNDYSPTICALGGDSPRFYLVAAKTTGYVSLNSYLNPTVISAASTINICDNVWHHICGVRDGTYHKLYIDGVEAGSATAGSQDINITDFYIGRVFHATYDHLGAAYIDDLFIFNRVLTVSEIALLASNLDTYDIKYHRRVRSPGLVSGIWKP